MKNTHLFHSLYCTFRLTILFLIILSSVQLRAQVDCERNFILQKQSQIDSFHLNFPSCCESPKSIYIMGSDITNLDSLVYVKQIRQDLIIQNNAQLLNLKGLRNLRSVSRNFFLFNNKELTHVDGLDMLSYSKILKIWQNEKLVNLAGLNGLAEANEIEIFESPGLVNPNAFNGLKKCGRIIIHDNPALINVDGFTGLKNAGWISIRLNPVLSEITAFKYTETMTSLDIDSNKLITIGGFEVLDSIRGFLRISNEPKLQSINGFKLLRRLVGNLEFRTLPMLTEIKGFINLRIIDEDVKLFNCNSISSINAFQVLRIVGGDIDIQFNESITSIKSFNLLDSCYGIITIADLPQLRTLNAFKNLKFIGSKLVVMAKNLEEFNAFQSLETIKGISSSNQGEGVINLVIQSDKINHLNEFSNLKFVRGLSLYQTPALNDLSGLNQIDTSYFKYLKFWNNPDFTACHSSFFCKYLEDPNHKYYVGGNAPGCNTREEILASCTTSTNEWYTNSTATSVFPNPCPLNSSLWSTGQEADFHLTLYTSTGQKAFEGTVSNPVNLPVNCTGLYHYRLTSDGKQKSGAVVVME